MVIRILGDGDNSSKEYRAHAMVDGLKVKVSCSEQWWQWDHAKKQAPGIFFGKKANWKDIE